MALEILKKNIESLNQKFKIEVRPLDWSSYLTGMRQRKFPIFLIGYMASFADPDAPTTAFLHSEGLYMKFQGHKVAQWDRLITEAAYDPNPSHRKQAYITLQTQAFEETPQIYLARPLTLRILGENIKGHEPNPIFPGVNFYSLDKQ